MSYQKAAEPRTFVVIDGGSCADPAWQCPVKELDSHGNEIAKYSDFSELSKHLLDVDVRFKKRLFRI